ncbi:hypothetical protein KL86APRO_10481 [uncultured Alphaproteobacteria bacterium]|uniref:Uncharacterized protein n=1 Tax=uncultured Alphaproteobacteria bacterium TaxID=91750 RepID=A0A212J421_9PROT|nr:hypothetical protein KL86APRO_10481 [uncultured Alphaproteobacteria bacterium]
MYPWVLQYLRSKVGSDNFISKLLSFLRKQENRANCYIFRLCAKLGRDSHAEGFI